MADLDISSVTYPDSPDSFDTLRITFSELVEDGTPWDLTKFRAIPQTGGIEPEILAAASVLGSSLYPSDFLILNKFNDLVGQAFFLDYFRDGEIPSISSAGGPAIVAPGVSGFGAGCLELDAVGAYVEYNGTNLANLIQTGTVQIRVRPGYSGTPTNTQTWFWSLDDGGSQKNLVNLTHLQSSGNVGITIYDSTGAPIVSGNFGVWAPTVDTWYTITLTFDVTPATGFGAKVYVDGILLGTVAGTGTRSNTTNWYGVGDNPGSGNTLDCLLDSLQVFNAVQYTANFTPPAEELSVDGGVEAVDLTVSTMTGETGLKDYKAQIEAGYVEKFINENETLDAPDNELAFTGQVVPFQVVSLEAQSVSVIRATFNRSALVIDDLLDPTRYTLDGGLEVVGVALVSDVAIDLYTTEQTAGQSYNLTITVP